MDAQKLIERYSSLKSKRDGSWLQVWREVRHYCYPEYSDYLPQGQVRGTELADTTAVKSRGDLAAGIYNWMAPPDKRWFELVPESDELKNDDEVKDFFSEVSKIVAVAMANSNWSTVLIQTLDELACGLDGIIYVEDGGRDSILNFRPFPIETVCYCENSSGRVDTLFHEIELTARQMGQEFAQVPEKIQEEIADPKRCDHKHKILHAVLPRSCRDAECIDAKNMPFADYYVDLESKQILQEGGFNEYPFAVCRFQKSANESYGRGPGLNLLPTIKMCNAMRTTYKMILNRIGEPSYIAPDGSIVDKEFNRDPGSLIYYKPDMGGAKPEMLPTPPAQGNVYQDIKDTQDEIRKGFFLDIFDPLGDLKQLTATEAEIRSNNALVPFAPIAGNLHCELFKPIIHRVFAIVSRRGLLPPLPPALQAHPDYKIEFVSKIALSIKKIEVLGWMQTEASLANIAAVKPEIMDNFDLDEIARDVALANGSSPKFLRSVKEREELRQQRAQVQAQQLAAEELTAGASALGANLNKAPEPGSPLEAVMANQGV